MKGSIYFSLISSFIITFPAIADDYKEIYPFKPVPSEEIASKVKTLSEDSEAIINIRKINHNNLSKGSTSTPTWSGPYWALKEGMIANPYQERSIFHVFNFIPTFDDIKPYEKRFNYIMSIEDQLTEKEIAKLAPSEKYDLLLGNGLDLSNRIWDFINNWKDDMKWNYLRSIDLPDDDYEIEKKNYIIANWEGICHGWAPASGVVPKPVKTVYATLPDGRKIPFYPEDIKGLISLTWANSLVQDNVLSEGLRCKRRYPKQDRYGRYYDTIPEDGKILPRCADIHPAVMHLALVNVIGKQGRSFIVDKASTIAVSNQPVEGYSFQYFHPDSGYDTTFEKALIPYEQYKRNDPFSDSRHPEIAYIIGVESTIIYADWTMIRSPKKSQKDKYGKLVSLYDLEIDANGNIIGGQWRGYKNLEDAYNHNGPRGGSDNGPAINLSRPDFLWVVPKDFKKYFKGNTSLQNWDITSGTPVPSEWKEASIVAHSFIYESSKYFGTQELCKVKNTNTDEVKEVPCEFRYPRPQPLIQVVDQLIELSKQ